MTRISETNDADFESFLCYFEEMATTEEIMVIASGQGNATRFQTNLNRLADQFNKAGGRQLSAAQYQLQISNQLAEHPELLKALSSLCIEIYKQHLRNCEVSKVDVSGKYFSLVWSVMSTFYNFTDDGVQLCLALSRVNILFTDYLSPMLANWSEAYATASQGCQKLVFSAIGFVYNLCYKNNVIINENLKRLGIVESVLPYMHSPMRNVKVQATLLVAFLLDENRSNSYESEIDVIDFLVNGLRASVSSSDRQYRSSGVCFKTSELLICIDRLTINDRNKALLVEFQLLPVLHRICSGDQESEIFAAVNILLRLSTRRENRALIQEQFSDVLRKLFASTKPHRPTGGLWRNVSAMQGLNQFMKLDKTDGPNSGRQPQVQPELQRQSSQSRTMGASPTTMPQSVTLNPNFTRWDFVLDTERKKQSLGSGGYGKVYKAITDKYQTVAVKIVKVTGPKSDRLEKAIEQEQKGIETLKEIRHQNIIVFLKCERTTSGKFCIFTELISGYSLSDLMNSQNKAFDESAVKNFSLQICTALNYLHCLQRPVLHRDIKGSNIMLTHEGVIKLIDFGLAKEIVLVTGTVRYSTEHAYGTPHYMAPELYDYDDKAQYTPKSDVWAFGCTVFEMMEMQPPNSNFKAAIVAAQIMNKEKDMPQLSAGASANLRDFYRRCVVKDSRDRADTEDLLRHAFLGQ